MDASKSAGTPWEHRGTPALAGFAPGARLPAIGRAQRWISSGGAEIWRVSAADASLADRIVGLGRQGLGGLVAAGRDEVGWWWIRQLQGRVTVHEHLRAQGDRPLDWRAAAELGRAIAGCLAHAEAASLLPGSLSPKQVLLGPPVELVAESLLLSLVGEASVRMDAGSAALSRWVAPAQAAGAPWDAAANRYVLGLMLYRMLAGHHPFTGQGLRRRLDAQVAAGAPPLADAIAATLPPGLQALTLRLLASEPGDRPHSAAAIGHELDALLAAPAVQPPRPKGPRPRRTPVPAPLEESEAPREPTVRAPPRAVPPGGAGAQRGMRHAHWGRRGLALAPVAVGIALAAVLQSAVPTATPSSDVAVPTVGARTPLTAQQTRPDDCGTCHPEQTAQWHLSVMAHAAKSPLFQSLEMLIQEQVGKSSDCPEGAGILRRADAGSACRDPTTGIAVTGSGGEHWCVNCHAPGENLAATVPAWDGLSPRSSSRRPLVDLMPASAMDGISCAFCHQVHGPVQPGAARRGVYEGNPDWISTATGRRFSSRPEDAQGKFGVANSGYWLNPAALLVDGAPAPRDAVRAGPGSGEVVPTGAHVRPTARTRDYLASSRFCGACHDVRLFGTDVLGAAAGEHFKRLRNAYSEWERWADDERRAGREAASCQDCHMSAFPGRCLPGLEPAPAVSDVALRRGCPPGTHFEAAAPGVMPRAMVATASGQSVELSTHYFTGVDIPLSDAFPLSLVDDAQLDAAGIPRGAQQRRDLLLGRTFRFEVGDVRRRGARLQVPILIENVGAGHRVPAGFSQEREFWVQLTVTDASGRVLYEVGRVDRGDEDLRDKVFTRINTDDAFVDAQGRPVGLFGADVADGPDVPQWSPRGDTGATEFRGRGLINLQNGFLRCVTCIGVIDAQGRCQPRAGQGRTRADRYDDGVYDIDTGACQSNLRGEEALLETYFPIGALDATRGLTRGPDAIIDRRSAAPGVPLRYTYELAVGGARGPVTVQARLLFRAFPPFLLRAFADYEARQAARGRRPSGPLVTHAMLERLEVVELHRLVVEVP